VLLVLLALPVNVALGGPRAWYGALGLKRLLELPVVLLRDVERRLNREQRSPAERAARGYVLALTVIVVALGAGACFDWLLLGLPFFECAVLAMALPARAGWDLAFGIRKALYKGNIEQARRELIGTPWRHHARLDEYGLGRAAVEHVSVTFGEKIVSPACWYLLLGLPGLFMVKAVTFLQERLPASSPSAQVFSRGAQMAHGFLHVLPSRLAGLLWLAASLFMAGPAGMRRAAARIAPALFTDDSQKLCLVGASAVLNLSLGGPLSLYARQAWMEGGPLKAGPADIRRALHAYALLNVLLFACLGLLLF
jgi:adenosylcobinamide-phosphate synthase